MSLKIAHDWTPIDRWWDDYVNYHRNDLEAVNELIDQSNSEWATNESIFMQDPLSEDWESQSPIAGPLRTNQEENWSQWLAHLIRSSNGRFTHELFDLPAHQSTTSVSREIHLSSDQHHNRRVDVIVEFPELSCSIELKIGDEHYEKSSEAAYLAETNADHDKPWRHYLLVPKLKRPAILDTFGDRINTSPEDTPTIQSETFVDVEIRWWSEVAVALRRTIPAESKQSWQASGYLFTILIEQKIIQLRSQTSIEQAIDRGTIPDISSLRSVDTADQIEHLNACLEDPVYE